MQQYPLSALVDKIGQEKAAAIFGVRQSAISKAIKTNRNITVTETEAGDIFAEEVRPFPAISTRKKQGNKA